MPLRALRTSMPRSRTHRRMSAASYALSACTLPGRRQPGPRRDHTAGTAFTSDFNASASFGVLSRNTHRPGDSRKIGEYVDLRSGLAAVDRAPTGHGSPLFARTDAASITARGQSIKTWLPVRRSSRTPSMSQSTRRSSGCIPSGLTWLAASASVHPFLRSRDVGIEPPFAEFLDTLALDSAPPAHRLVELLKQRGWTGWTKLERVDSETSRRTWARTVSATE